MQKPNSHKAKQKLARRNMTQLEINNKVPMYLSKYWRNRQLVKMVKVLKTNAI